jgi:catechol 2,3-dioxygenase-like lactoylglutathione lyase family enzyme
MPRIVVTNIYVDDQAEALSFYTEKLGFVKKNDIPLGEARWLTVVSPDDPEGTQLLLEPADHPAVKPFRDALVEDGIPSASFAVADVGEEYDRLTSLGVEFIQKPLQAGPVTTAVLDDTCGNLIQLAAQG